MTGLHILSWKPKGLVVRIEEVNVLSFHVKPEADVTMPNLEVVIRFEA